ncbi:MAG: hypothetical protein Q6351_009225 [Candidatus Njordarchaeum guaymaensis]
MKIKNGILIGAIITLVTLLSTPVYSLGAPSWNSNTATIEAPGIVVRFFDRQPHYLIWVPGENGTTVYFIKFLEIDEFVDQNGNGLYEENERVAFSYLTGMGEWNIYAETLEGPDNSTELRITMQATIMIQPTTFGNSTANVTFVNHIFDKDVDLNGYEIAGGKEVKIDIIIENWPWKYKNSMLALGIIFGTCDHQGREYRAQIHQREHANHQEGVELEHGELGYKLEFRYQDEVRVRNGDQEELIEINGTLEEKQNKDILYLVYPHFEDKLVHDPSIKATEGTEFELPTNYMIPIGVAGVAIVAAVAIYAVFRRKG